MKKTTQKINNKTRHQCPDIQLIPLSNSTKSLPAKERRINGERTKSESLNGERRTAADKRRIAGNERQVTAFKFGRIQNLHVQLSNSLKIPYLFPYLHIQTKEWAHSQSIPSLYLGATGRGSFGNQGRRSLHHPQKKKTSNPWSSVPKVL